MEIMDKDHFLTIVSKDAVVRTHGRACSSWPPENFWAMISTVKSNITDDQIPQLMASYNVDRLIDNQPAEINYDRDL